ncbi:ADP-ribosylglycohydrolase [Aaosphaeria arxii CBS 175.79]|uniref:ADP-ribosylglycohydrolase n=1 Tax=Aaosphaeria arxii CBS 175.79 TaxID=1450172 RepID=A0A6A5XBW9_9PLEO|nr:ADP-ribosylglycohydrolase [Aaosphaeria arxii CBS 175.79]KAF2010410.1 ADP-ribosylglycohydrolase [Aaosphaeria arxii CBS 175.79]
MATPQDDFVHVPSPTTTNPLSSTPQPQATADNTSEPSLLAFLSDHPFIRESVVDRIYGCIVGSALGDTIGLYTEFLPQAACERVYGKIGEFKFRLAEPGVTEAVNDSHRNRFDPRCWTDDTDQSLLIILSYLHNRSQPDHLADHLASDFASRLKIWISQGLLALGRPPCGIGSLVGSVVLDPHYLGNPVGVATNQWLKTGRRVAPNGSLMRSHPLGVIGVGLSEEETVRLAGRVGGTTHVDPRCVVCCCILVVLVRGLLRCEVRSERDVDAAIERCYAFVNGPREGVTSALGVVGEDMGPGGGEGDAVALDRGEFEKYVYAEGFEVLEIDDRKTMGYVYKCLGSAVLSLRMAMREVEKRFMGRDDVFEERITELVLRGGDADTNATVAGGLLGAYLGFGNLPKHWVNGLDHREWLMKKTERLIKVVGVEDGKEELVDEKDEAADGGKGLMTEHELRKRDGDLLMLILQRDKAGKEKEAAAKKQKQHKGGLANWFKTS